MNSLLLERKFSWSPLCSCINSQETSQNLYQLPIPFTFFSIFNTHLFFRTFLSLWSFQIPFSRRDFCILPLLMFTIHLSSPDKASSKVLGSGLLPYTIHPQSKVALTVGHSVFAVFHLDFWMWNSSDSYLMCSFCQPPVTLFIWGSNILCSLKRSIWVLP